MRSLVLFVAMIFWVASVCAQDAPVLQHQPALPTPVVSGAPHTAQQKQPEPQAASGNANQALELPASPKSLDGCWVGPIIDKPAYFEQLRGVFLRNGPKVVGYLKSASEECFGRASDGTLKIEYPNGQGHTVVDTADAEERGYPYGGGSVRDYIVSTDGKTEVKIHTVAAEEITVRALGLSSEEPVESVTDSTCTLLAEQDILHCEESTLSYFGRDGIPWTKEGLHYDLHRLPSPSSP